MNPLVAFYTLRAGGNGVTPRNAFLQRGQVVEYWSDTHQQWVKTKVVASEPKTGKIQIEVVVGSIVVNMTRAKCDSRLLLQASPIV